MPETRDCPRCGWAASVSEWSSIYRCCVYCAVDIALAHAAPEERRSVWDVPV